MQMIVHCLLLLCVLTDTVYLRMFRLSRPHVFFKRALNTFGNIVKSPKADIDVPKNILLQQYLLENINKWTDNVALECIETKRSYTYLDLRNKSLALAHFFKNSLKLEEKSCVGILLPNIPDYPIILLAAFQAGFQITPINPNYTQEEVKKQLTLSKAKVLFCLAERDVECRRVCDSLKIPVIALKINEATSLSRGTINFSECVASKHQNLNEIYTKNVTSGDVALLPFSSGTTGLPKGVQLSHNNIVSNLMQIVPEEFNFLKKGQDETVLVFLPFFHIYALSMVLLHGLSEGVKLVTFPKFTSQSFITGLREYRPTFIPTVPPVVHLINNSPDLKPSEDLASVGSILCGAAPLGETDMVRFKEITNGKVTIFQAYGMTETSPLTVIQTEALKGGIKLGGSGYLVPNTQAKFISVGDPGSPNPLAAKENGELLIKGPQVMKGYLDNPEATKEVLLEDGWIRTGDIGHYDEDGHIFITDRLKELIKVQGFQVAPAELEAIIREHPSVEDVAVVGMKHEKLGEAPRAFIVQKKDVSVKPEEIQEFVAAKVVKYKRLVGGVRFLKDIPKTVSGKILRKELRRIVDAQ